jgi:hypothetical protein
MSSDFSRSSSVLLTSAGAYGLQIVLVYLFDSSLCCKLLPIQNIRLIFSLFVGIFPPARNLYPGRVVRVLRLLRDFFCLRRRVSPHRPPPPPTESDSHKSPSGPSRPHPFLCCHPVQLSCNDFMLACQRVRSTIYFNCQLLQVHLHLIPSHALPTHAMNEAEMYVHGY